MDEISGKRVPREPTEAMLDAAHKVDVTGNVLLFTGDYRELWHAMYDAAPEDASVALEPPPEPHQNCPIGVPHCPLCVERKLAATVTPSGGNSPAELQRTGDYALAALLKIRVALGLHRDSSDNLLDVIASLRELAGRSTRRLAELSEPGSIGAFAARDAAVASAEKAERENAALQERLAEAERALRHVRNIANESGTNQGYGFYRPANPHDFFPDHESSTPEEIAAHKAACEAFDNDAYQEPRGSEWIGEGDFKVHILRAPWGIGSYPETEEWADSILKAIDAALASAATKGE